MIKCRIFYDTIEQPFAGLRFTVQNSICRTALKDDFVKYFIERHNFEDRNVLKNQNLTLLFNVIEREFHLEFNKMVVLMRVFWIQFNIPWNTLNSDNDIQNYISRPGHKRAF